jgi:uncharacterized protein
LHLIKIIHPAESQITRCSPQEFEKIMNVSFISHLTFKDDKIFRKIIKKCKSALKRGDIETKQKWLGALFSKEITEGTSPDLIIKWIDSQLGYGVFTDQDIIPLTFIGEYTGEVRKRRWFADKKNDYCFDYFIGETIKSPFIIDAEHSGNYTRFINHSKQPNLEPVSVICGDIMHVILISKCHIPKGTQLCYDYGEAYWSKRAKALPL